MKMNFCFATLALTLQQQQAQTMKDNGGRQEGRHKVVWLLIALMNPLDAAAAKIKHNAQPCLALWLQIE